ncbi:MAG: DUF3263 domain-containing protein, partial [Sporichthyaceae bacterium]|nr:DUF3263 domain-containing protein [Sporichthyaceae bacterium]
MEPASTNAFAPSEGVGELAERDQRILGFERQWWKYAGA